MGGLLGQFSEGDTRSDLGAAGRSSEVIKKIGLYNSRVRSLMGKLAPLKNHNKVSIRNKAVSLINKLRNQEQKLGQMLRNEMKKPIAGGDRVRDEDDRQDDNRRGPQRSEPQRFR